MDLIPVYKFFRDAKAFKHLDDASLSGEIILAHKEGGLIVFEKDGVIVAALTGMPIHEDKIYYCFNMLGLGTANQEAAVAISTEFKRRFPDYIVETWRKGKKVIYKQSFVNKIFSYGKTKHTKCS